MRNEEDFVCSVCLFRCNNLTGVKIIKEMPGSVASGTPCISVALFIFVSLHLISDISDISNSMRIWRDAVGLREEYETRMY